MLTRKESRKCWWMTTLWLSYLVSITYLLIFLLSQTRKLEILTGSLYLRLFIWKDGVDQNADGWFCLKVFCICRVYMSGSRTGFWKYSISGGNNFYRSSPEIFFKLVKIIRHFIRSVEWFQNLPWYFSMHTVKLLGFRHLENISDLVYWKTYPAVRNIHKIQTHDTHKKFERTFQGKFCKNLWLTNYFPRVLITTQRTW